MCKITNKKPNVSVKNSDFFLNREIFNTIWRL